MTAATALAARSGEGSGRAFALYSGASSLIVLVSWIASSVMTGLDFAGIWSPAPSELAERVEIVASLVWSPRSRQARGAASSSRDGCLRRRGSMTKVDHAISSSRSRNRAFGWMRSGPGRA